MTAKDETITTGLDRLNAAFAWWGIPTATGSGQIDAPMKRCQAFVADLQKLYSEAYSNEIGTMRGANDKFVAALQEFLRGQQPQDVIAAEASVLATMLEAASAQAKFWSELTQKIQECCAAMARDTADELRKRAGQGADAQGVAKAA